MPLTLPSTVDNPTTGQPILAALGDSWNDAVAYLGQNRPHCRATRTSNLSIADATWTAVTLTTEDYDVGGNHSTVSATSRLTVPSGEDGKYDIKFGASFAASGTGERRVAIYKNGTVIPNAMNMCNASVIGTTDLSVSCDIALVAGDYVEGYVYQNSTGALNVASAALTYRWWAL